MERVGRYPRSRQGRFFRAIGGSTSTQWLALPGVILAIALVTGFIEPRFWGQDNIMNLIRQMAPLMILAVGQSFAVISGGLDLSLAAVLALAGVLGALVMQEFGLAAGVTVMVLTGTAGGMINGLIITKFQVSPFIVTLGMLSTARGLALVLAGGLPIYNLPDSFVDLLGYGTVAGFPAGGIVAMGAVLLGLGLLRFTVFGRYIYAIGSNASAAANSGVNVQRYTLLIYMFAGTMAGLAAVVLTAWVAAAQPLAAEGLELKSLAAVVVGGIALTGGSGSMLHVFLGVLVLGLLSNSLNMIGVSSFMQTIAIGLVIIIAAVLDRLRSNAK